jgi:hypothetical protein
MESRINGDLALDLLRLVVEYAGIVVHAPVTAGHLGQEKDGFRQGGLTDPPWAMKAMVRSLSTSFILCSFFHHE